MPGTRVAFRDPSTGRFISGDAAAGLERAIRLEFTPEGRREQVLEFGSVLEDLTPSLQPNWGEDERDWAFVWDAGEEGMDLGALNGATIPEGVTQFRVVGQVEATDDYSDGYATSDWLDIDRFPPSLNIFEGKNPTGISRIYFEKAR
jgi:hypothetical protein